MNPAFVEDLVSRFKAGLDGGNITKDHRDYVLIKELYHCTPSELEEQEERLLNFHFQCLMAERKHESIMFRKDEQKRKVKQILSK